MAHTFFESFVGYYHWALGWWMMISAVCLLIGVGLTLGKPVWPSEVYLLESWKAIITIIWFVCNVAVSLSSLTRRLKLYKIKWPLNMASAFKNMPCICMQNVPRPTVSTCNTTRHDSVFVA